MPKDFRDELLTFSLDHYHRIIIRGAELRFAWRSGDLVTFHVPHDPRQTIAYEVRELNRMNRAGEISVIPYALMPEKNRPAPVCADETAFIAGLPPAQRNRLKWRYAMVRGVLELMQDGGVASTDASIAANMDAIRTAAAPYLEEDLPNPDDSLKLRNWEAGQGRKPRTPTETTRPGPCSPRALRSWLASYRTQGKTGLIDRSAKQGNVRSPFSVEEITLLSTVVRKEYLSEQRKSQEMVVLDVKARFAAENTRRKAEGLPPLTVPGRDAVRGFIRRIDRFETLVARHGIEFALNKMRPVGGGLQVSRPFERVEMDEQKIDLITLFSETGLIELFSTAELEELGLLDKTKRWWLVLAIDCRTRCILGMVLTCNPSASAAVKCLRMVVSDKGRFADKAGALSPWSMIGTPEMLATDNGAAFKSSAFTDACTDLGITTLRTVAGAPSMRGIGESVFRSVSQMLCRRLPGYTFSTILDRAHYESEKRACLSLDDLCFALVRWAVDAYHNRPHPGLYGRTPLQQWEADLGADNAPLRSAPKARSRHIALGVPLSRTLQKDGLRVMNICYNSGKLPKWFLDHGNCSMEIRWNEEDLGTIEVFFNGDWQTVEAAQKTFKGVHASIWLRSMRSLRAVDPRRKEWEEETIFKAIRDIEAMNAQAKLSFGMLDQSWTPERLKQLESDALMTFETVPTREKTAAASDGHGLALRPVAPDDHSGAPPEVDPQRHRKPTPRKAAGSGADPAPDAAAPNTAAPNTAAPNTAAPDATPTDAAPTDRTAPATQPAGSRPASRLGLQFPSRKPPQGEPK